MGPYKPIRAHMGLYGPCGTLIIPSTVCLKEDKTFFPISLQALSTHTGDGIIKVPQGPYGPIRAHMGPVVLYLFHLRYAFVHKFKFFIDLDTS